MTFDTKRIVVIFLIIVFSMTIIIISLSYNLNEVIPLDAPSSYYYVANDGDDWTDKYLEGLEWMKEHGKVIYVPYTKGISTSLIKQKLH